jgi:3-deoxy-D-manno-octulosonic-acid transferase
MAYSLGLTLYNLANRRDAGAAVERPPRPAGRLVWLHAPGLDAARALMELARRLVEEDAVAVVLTCPDPLPRRAGIILQPPPADVPAEAAAFLDHWRPEVVVMSEGELRPALLHEAMERKLPLLMVGARNPVFLRERDGWYPGLMRGLLAEFRAVLTLDEPSARAFRKAGATPSAVEVTGKLEEESAALPCTEAERDAMARQLATRPVWLAAALPEAEEASVIAAHRTALRLAHRLLLIVVPQDPGRVAPLAQRMEKEEGWSVARRAEEEEPRQRPRSISPMQAASSGCGIGWPPSPSWAAVWAGAVVSATRWRRQRWDRPFCTGRDRGLMARPSGGWARRGRRGRWDRRRIWPRRWGICCHPTGRRGWHRRHGPWRQTGPR